MPRSGPAKRDRAALRAAAVLFLLAAGMNLAGVGFLLPAKQSAYYDDLTPAGPLGLLAGFPDAIEPVYGPFPQLCLLLGQAPALLPALASGAVRIDRAQHLVHIANQDTAAALILSGRAFTALLGAGAVVLLFLAARRLYSERAALLGALLVALCPVHVYFSHTGSVTTQTTFWLAAALWAAAGDERRPAVRRAALLGLFVALAAATKEYAAACAAGWGVVLLYDALRRSRDGGRRLAAFVVAFVAAYLLVSLAWLSPRALLDHLAYYRSGGSAEAGSGSFFWRLRNPLLSFAPTLLLSAAVLFEVNLIGGAAALWGLVRAALERPARRALLAPALGLFLLIQVPFGQILYQYVLPLNIVGFLVFGAVADRLWQERRRGRRALAAGLLALSALALVAQSAMLQADLATDGRRPLGQWLERHVGPAALIWTFSPRESAPFSELRVAPRIEDQWRSGAALAAERPAALVLDNQAAWQMLYNRGAFPRWPRFLTRLAAGRLGYAPVAEFHGWRERSGNFFGIGQRYVVFAPAESSAPAAAGVKVDPAALGRSIFWREYFWMWARPLDEPGAGDWRVVDALPPGRPLQAWVLGRDLWVLVAVGDDLYGLYRLPLDDERVILVAAWRAASFPELWPSPLVSGGELWFCAKQPPAPRS